MSAQKVAPVSRNRSTAHVHTSRIQSAFRAIGTSATEGTIHASNHGEKEYKIKESKLKVRGAISPANERRPTKTQGEPKEKTCRISAQGERARAVIDAKIWRKIPRYCTCEDPDLEISDVTHAHPGWMHVFFGNRRTVSS